MIRQQFLAANFFQNSPTLGGSKAVRGWLHNCYAALNEDPINPVIYSALHVRLRYVKSYPEAKAVLHLYNTLTADDTDGEVHCPDRIATRA
jgi:hypothetical protein